MAEEQEKEPLTNEERNQKIEELREKRKAREQSDLLKVLSQKEGRRLVWRILSMAGVFALSYTPQDPDHTIFCEGKRSVGNLLLKDIPPEIELAMKREAANDKLLNEVELKEIANA